MLVIGDLPKQTKFCIRFPDTWDGEAKCVYCGRPADHLETGCHARPGPVVFVDPDHVSLQDLRDLNCNEDGCWPKEIKDPSGQPVCRGCLRERDFQFHQVFIVLRKPFDLADRSFLSSIKQEEEKRRHRNYNQAAKTLEEAIEYARIAIQEHDQVKALQSQAGKAAAKVAMSSDPGEREASKAEYKRLTSVELPQLEGRLIQEMVSDKLAAVELADRELAAPIDHQTILELVRKHGRADQGEAKPVAEVRKPKAPKAPLEMASRYTQWEKPGD